MKKWKKQLAIGIAAGLCLASMLSGSAVGMAALEDEQAEALPENVRKEVDRLHDLAMEKAQQQLGVRKGRAVSSKTTAGSTVYLDRGDRLRYSNYSTFIYNINNNGEVREGYCVEPAKGSPNDGDYQAINAYTIDGSGNGALDIQFLRAALWFSYGAPGFDASLFPSQYYDGSPMGPNEYRIASHLLVSKVFQNDSMVIQTGTTPEYFNWYYTKLTGDKFSDSYIDQNNAWNQLIYGGRYREVPDSFEVYFVYSGGRQLIAFWEYNPIGYAHLTKQSSNGAITEGNACYSLEGAQYGVYTDEACKNQVAALTTDPLGSTNTVELEEGRYYVKEIKAPEGYYLDEKVYPVDVTGGEIIEVPVSDEPGNDPAAITLDKIDAETGRPAAQGGASLAGAQFTVKYYDGYYTENDLPAEPERTWVIETKEVRLENGEAAYRAALSEAHKVGGDEFYQVNGRPTLPLGTITVEETRAPEGYQLEHGYLQSEGSARKAEGVYVSQITMEGQNVSLKGGNRYIYNEKVMRGGVSIQKRDLETKESRAQGNASLQFTAFDIVSMNDAPVVVEGKQFEKEEVVKRIYTDIAGTAVTAPDLLPYGSYQIRESSAPEGYLVEGAYPIEFQIVEEGRIVDLTGADRSIHNQIKRGDLEGVKIGSGSHKRLAGVPFEIRSKTTGESHLVVTDKNGQFSTSADWAPHTENTNRGETSEDGVWFGTSAPDDAYGALPYDTYEIIERECEANEGYDLIPPFEVTIYRDRQVIDLGTLVDESPKVPEPIKIRTNAVNQETGEKTIDPKEGQIIEDTVSLEGLTVGVEYKLVGWQMIAQDRAELLDSEGKRVEHTVTFTAEEEAMELAMPFTIDASELAGKDLVAFEELYEMTDPESPEKVAEHKDIEDEGQTVTVGEPVKPEPEPEEPEVSEAHLKAAKTGDKGNLIVLALLCICSCAVLIICVKISCKTK